jgi:hypothetical protein
MKWNPIKWARQIVFLALLALDYQHTYEFILAHETGTQAHELVPIFGPLFNWAAMPMTNGVFDAHAYAFVVTATIFFMSNTLAHRLSRNNASWMYWAAMGVGVLLSGLTNAGTMFFAATGTDLIPSALIGPVAATLGGVVTAGLLMFASMDAWDLKARYEKTMATRAKNRAARDELAKARERKEKFTPNKYKAAEA